jgi:hypothetical protein
MFKHYDHSGHISTVSFDSSDEAFALAAQACLIATFNGYIRVLAFESLSFRTSCSREAESTTITAIFGTVGWVGCMRFLLSGQLGCPTGYKG